MKTTTTSRAGAHKPEIVVCGIPFGKPDEEKKALRLVKEHGFTSVQIYTFWKEFEPEKRGVFDWRHYDRQVDLIQEAGLKYLPFLLMGPKYAAPAWWLADRRHRGLKCLEHGRESPIESIWNPHWRPEVERVVEAFAAHYLPMNVLEAVMPGICGDYGEAIFPVLGNWPGDYHTHCGLWCGDRDAVASFRTSLRQKYGSVSTLNKAWRSSYSEYSAVVPFLRHRAPSRTAFFDLVEWYRASMTEFSDFWMATLRRHFSSLPLYLCTGGCEEPEHGSLFAAQARACAKHGAGLRLTNEGNKFYDNLSVTAHCVAATKFYGAGMGLEPVGPITEKGVRTRIFSSLAFGNRQTFHYYENLFEDGKPKPAARALPFYIRHAGERKEEKSLALFWPQDRALLEGGMPPDVKQALVFIRRRCNVSAISEPMIEDGALDGHAWLVMIGAASVRRNVLAAIANWVKKRGGRVLAVGSVRDLELEVVPEFDEVFGLMPDSEPTTGHAMQIVRPASDLPRFSALPPFGAGNTWMGLSRGAERLAAAKAEAGYSGTRVAEVSAFFRRQWPKGGQGLFYSGPVNFDPDPEAIFADPGVFSAILGDICALSGLPDLTPAKGEIARAVTDEGMLSLKDGAMEALPGP